MALVSSALALTQILYIRHGEVPGNDPNPATYVYTGCKTDDSLTEKGHAQAKICADRIAALSSNGDLGKITAVYTSTLKRAIETGQPIGQKLGIPLQQRHDLREIYWGDADGQLVAEMTAIYHQAEKQVKKDYSDRRERWDHLPVFKDAEKFNALLKRSVDEISELAKKHLGETIIIVGHGRVLKTLISDQLDKEDGIPYPANCGIAEFSYSDNDGLRFVKVLQETLPSKL